MNSVTLSNVSFDTKTLNVIFRFYNTFKNEPCYVYFSEKIRKKCKLFLELPYQNKSIYFASMANSHPEFLKIIKNEGLKIFVNSKLHLELALDAGFQGAEVIYTASAMSKETMKFINNHNVLVNLDSVKQLYQWNKMFPLIKVGIRCNIGNSVKPKQTRGGYFIGKDSRLGFSTEEIESLKGNNIVKGLHLYVGTDIIDVSYFIDCYKELIKLAGNFPSIEYIDVGGGFGIEEQDNVNFDFITYGKEITKLMNDFSREAGRSIQLILEPGRIIGGEAGYFVCTVIDIKERNGTQFVGVNASSVQFPRPLLYPDDSWHPVHLFSSDGIEKNADFRNSSVYGSSTYSRDFFAKDIELPEAKINDIFIFGNAGSYCASSHLKFLGYAPAKEIFV